MSEHKTIHEAMLAVQSELTNPIKSATNPHFKSKYATLPDIRDMVTPILAKHGLYCIQPVLMDDRGGYLQTRIVHAATADQLMSEMPLMLEKQTPQGMGSAITYARRYALCSILNIAADDDDDGNAASQTKADIRTDAADLWPVAEQEEWYKAATTLFSGDLSVEALFAWGTANGNEKRLKSFHDEKRGEELLTSYRDSLVMAAQYDIDAIDGLQELGNYWKTHAIKLKNRTGDKFKDIEQAKDTRKAQLNANV